MLRYKLAVTTIFILAAGLLWPGLAYAQGPECGTGGTLISGEFHFNNSLEGWVYAVNGDATYALEANRIRIDTNGGNNENWSFDYDLELPAGSTIVGSSVTTVTMSSNASCGGGIWGLTTYSSPNTQFGSLVNATFAIANGVAAEGFAIGQNVGTNCSGDFDFYIDEFSYSLCVSDVTQTCSTVDNPDFDDTSAWLLAGSAGITNSVLTLTPGDSAAQNLSTLTSQTTYDVTLYVSQATTGSLDISLGNDSLTQIGINPGVLTTTFTTPDVGVPLTFKLYNVGSTNIDIDYACLSLAATGPGGETQTTCLAPTNGDFSSPTGWDFYRGATWQEPAYTVNLPQPEQGLVKTTSAFSLPTLATGENLLMSFHAWGDGGDAGIAGRISGLTTDYILAYDVYAEPYVIEVDVSVLPETGENSAVVAFANPGDEGLESVFSSRDVIVDNICLFVTDRGPNLPQPVDPDGYNPINIGSFYTCSDVAGYLAGWGIDMRYHQINYETTPSIWNPEDWVPWLISAIFVSIEIYVCSFLVLIQTLINLAEYLLNNALNYGNWGVDSADGWLTYLNGFFDTIWQSAKNWLSSFPVTLENWLIWAGNAVIEFAGIPDQVVAAWLLNMLTWIPAINPILALALAIVEVALADGGNLSKGITGQILDAIIGELWNGSMVPYLEYILFFLAATGPLALLNVIPEFWALLWAVIQYLWENVFQTINIPLSFYNGLSDGVQSTAFAGLISCDGSELNFWCNMFAGMDLLNGIAGHSIFYPIVIVGVIIGTIIILYRNMLALWNFYADWITRI